VSKQKGRQVPARVEDPRFVYCKHEWATWPDEPALCCHVCGTFARLVVQKVSGRTGVGLEVRHPEDKDLPPVEVQRVFGMITDLLRQGSPDRKLPWE
jgi:hypothetical protein